MSWFNFWKHEDRVSGPETNLELPEINTGIGLAKEEPSVFEMSKNPDVGEMRGLYDTQRSTAKPQMVPQNSISSPDMQIISAKLDTIKAMLDLINQRLTIVERNAEENKTKKVW